MNTDENDGDIQIEELEPDLQAAYYLQIVLEKVRQTKPNDHSPKSRYCAIAISDLERIAAYFDYYVIRGE